MAAKPARTRPTRTDKLLGLDGRERLSLAIKQARLAYLSMCPQPVAPTDAAICERLAVTEAHLALLDAKGFAAGSMEPGQIRIYTTLSGQHSRLLRQLNARRSVRPVGPTLDEIFGEGAAA